MIERISFLSQLTEVDKSILFSAVAGFFGGLVQCSIEDTFDKFVNQKEININNLLPKYVYSGFICGILVGLGVFITLIFDETTSTENITQSFIPYAILIFPVVGITNKLFERISSRNQS
ncbi:hypothetical protein [Mastigocoleus testarum]|uniref:Uncharacterized protein n=1 Tax=Mastigocoleus testarum BC008 TaxID=371196 RepID=A0A0V7ZKB9_9CYAN|nr:hypothetical protein [Mastigocoleus testarum]KST64940.1 hypothetical protein BC008_19205 [Mastigocoleus testarum BC008]KST65011.1 hypothetical protein BC008_19600 [Mastigocoleus testarum BC008]